MRSNLPDFSFQCSHLTVSLRPTKDGRPLWWWVGLAMLCMQGSDPGHLMSVTEHYFNHK